MVESLKVGQSTTIVGLEPFAVVVGPECLGIGIGAVRTVCLSTYLNNLSQTAGLGPGTDGDLLKSDEGAHLIITFTLKFRALCASRSGRFSTAASTAYVSSRGGVSNLVIAFIATRSNREKEQAESPRR